MKEPPLSTSPHPRVRVAVLNWNGGDMTARCLEKLAATDWPREQLDLVLVDNGSTDDSVASACAAVPKVSVIQNGANLGFVGLNSALRNLDDNIAYVALINNDAFVEPGWLEPLVDALQSDPALGATSARMVFAPKFQEIALEAQTRRAPGDSRDLGVQLHDVETALGSVFGSSQYPRGWWGLEGSDNDSFRWSAGDAVLRAAVPPDQETAESTVTIEVSAPRQTDITISSNAATRSVTVGPERTRISIPVDGTGFDVINNAGSVWIDDGHGADRGFMAIDESQYDTPADIFNWCGGAVLLRREYLDEVGVLDDRLFLYYEDADLSWRGKLAGWNYRYVPDSMVRHEHAATSVAGSDVFEFYVERNRLMVTIMNGPWWMIERAFKTFILDLKNLVLGNVIAPLRHGRRPQLRQLRNRLRSLGSLVRMMPGTLRARRLRRGRAVATDDELSQYWLSSSEWAAHERSIKDSAGRSATRAGSAGR